MTLLEALKVGPRDCLTLIGGGGKTTCLYALGRQARARGWPTLLSTTTRVYPPPPDIPLGARPTSEVPLIFSAGPEVSGKLTPPPILAPGDYLCLLEADGSRGLPLKFHAAHEPVVPSFATRVVAVVGVSALGQAGERSVHRWDSLCRDWALEPKQCVDEDLVLRLVDTYRQRAPVDSLILNQAEVNPDGARRLAGALGGTVVLRSHDQVEVWP